MTTIGPFHRLRLYTGFRHYTSLALGIAGRLNNCPDRPSANLG
jgi:hypothetical protein